VPLVHATLSVVGTSTATTVNEGTFQKKTFYCNNNSRWYVFYSNDSSHVGWETSADGTTWSGTFNYFDVTTAGYGVDVWYDENPPNKIRVARVNDTASVSGLFYRQGSPQSDGTITWDTNSILVFENVSQLWVINRPSISVDSNGYPWLAWMSGSAASTRVSYVCKATSTDGSSWGSPTILWTETSGGYTTAIRALSNGKMIVVRGQTTAIFKSRLYNGTDWEPSVDATTSTQWTHEAFDVVADGDDVHLAFSETTTYHIHYYKYTYGSGWGAEEDVDLVSLASGYNPALTLKFTDDVRI